MAGKKEDSTQDYYQILGVEYSVNQEDIEDAYHELARKLHPDITGDKPELTRRYMLVNEAYQVLSKPENRAEYDASIGVEKLPEGTSRKQAVERESDRSSPGEDMRRLDAKLKYTVRQAEGLCRKSNFWEATRLLEKFLKTHPDNAQLRKVLAKAALGRKRYHEAVNHMKIACKVEYHSPENFVMLGEMYLEGGQLVLAEKALREALGWNAEHEGALRMMSRIRELKDAEKPPIQRIFRKVAKALSRKE